MNFFSGLVVFLLAKVLGIFFFIVAAIDIGRPLFLYFYLLSASSLVSERICLYSSVIACSI
jgi:hypothetical protein